ncbi:RNA polymerase II elongation factor [Puccinia graminis f. sp. tritici]|uniref:RNA polymerase II elongation factor n=2 Tax=Puccinia graminis f. sp. tritici TaxID=56615 RepID=E3KZ60_PUCGT|nr:uncharacterized protein PGTG_15734 [Puccinia graminis f. sp. tritici CRL 75-36-700-3]EFP89585.1 hypothetical protein PGTG_15734 [Puccinia graminis f. sp. tritici CRL 75-36-700-3]KAA1074406.1 RNA polymerase II elongation factor [Puccinia graminis f. sp. tritici]
MTTSHPNRSHLEIANSLKKQLVTSLTASNEKEIKECLERIKKEVHPSEELIRATKIGITVGKQRQNSNPEIAKIAKSIINQWKSHMKKEPTPSQSSSSKNGTTTSASSNSNNNPKSPSLSSSQHSNMKSPRPDQAAKLTTLSTTTSPEKPTATTTTTTTTATTSATNSNNPATGPSATTVGSSQPKSTPQFSPNSNGTKIKRNGPRSSKTEDPSLNFELYKDEKVRNGSLKAVFDALIFDSDAPADLIYERAKAIETEVNKTHDSNGYKIKMRSLIFNLRDKNNPGLRESVVSGEISAGRLCVMGPQDMASEERKAQDRKLAEENLFKARGAGPQQAETDAFRCARCGQRKCTYYQMQTRSADEPMTTFVTCVNCNCRWKFS